MPEIHSIPLLFTGSQWQLFAVARSFPVHFGDHLQSEDHLWCNIRCVGNKIHIVKSCTLRRLRNVREHSRQNPSSLLY